MSPASADPKSRRRLVALVAAGIVLLLLAGVGVYGLLTGPRNPSTDDPRPEPSPTVTTPLSPGPSTPLLPKVPAVPRSTDPVTFAEGVATTLFAWDTALGLWPLDYTSAILTVGDPSGDEQAGLASDIATYLPNRDVWIELRQYATSQHITIDTAYVPDAWADAVEQAVRAGDFQGLTAAMGNTFEELVIPNVPQVADCQQRLTALGLQPLMAGSGPTVFALVPPGQEETVRSQTASWHDVDVYMTAIVK